MSGGSGKKKLGNEIREPQLHNKIENRVILRNQQVNELESKTKRLKLEDRISHCSNCWNQATR